ncbi:MAG: hypothetical protein QXS93_02315 [Candidatus Micrarchaeia archaeon]
MRSVLAEVKLVNNILGNYELPSGEDDCESKIEELSEIRERLIEEGFNRSFMPRMPQNIQDLPRSEISEIKRQIKEMRYVAYLKKSTLRRVDNAMASYKVALIHYKSGALGNAYRYLPYDGNLVWRISRVGAIAARLYFDIYELLSGELEQLGISVDVALPSEEGVKYERLQLYKVNDLDDYIAENYGKEAEIVKTKIITRHRSILSSKTYRKVLACAYAVNSASSVSVPEDKGDEKHELLQKYLRVLRKYGIKEIVRIDTYQDIREDMIDELQKEMLVYFDQKGTMYLDDDLSIKLNEIISKRYWEYAKDAYSKMSIDLIRLLMLTTRETRREMGVFSFDDDTSLLQPLVEKSGLAGIIKASEMVNNKLRIEDAFGTGRKKIGLAVFAHYQGKRKLKEVFGVDFKDIEEDYRIVDTYLKGGSGRGGEFLEHLKE